MKIDRGNQAEAEGMRGPCYQDGFRIAWPFRNGPPTLFLSTIPTPVSLLEGNLLPLGKIQNHLLW